MEPNIAAMSMSRRREVGAEGMEPVEDEAGKAKEAEK